MELKSNLYILYSAIFLILCQINLSTSNYISIPFKIFAEENPTFVSDDYYISDFVTNKIYFPLQIGDPHQLILGTLNSLEYELLMKKGDFIYEKHKSFYNTSISNYFSVIAEQTLSYFDSFDSNYVQDLFNFCIKFDFDNRKCEIYKAFKVNFILFKKSSLDPISDREELSKKNFIEIGLNLKTHYGTKYSLIKNLYDNKYISSNTWFIYYFPKIVKDNSIEEEQGVLIYGADPINFFKDKYNSSSIAYTQGINKNYDYGNYWSIIFNEVKMKSLKTNEDILLDNNVQGVINHNYKGIVGSHSYMEKIEENFFNYYIYEGFCDKKLLNDKFYYYICNSNLLPMSQIKNTFPILYLKQIDFNYIFELDVNDLFITKGDYIFFLVVFNKNNPTNSFLLGNIFLKKYFFYFDNDKSEIAFLQENNNNQKINKEETIIIHWYNSPGTFVVLIILFIFIGLVGFYYGRKIYFKRKLRANELEDQFDYRSQKEGNKSQKFDLEMKLGI